MSKWGTCKQCGKGLDYYSRSNKETCSDNCRKAWSRRKTNLKRDADRLMTAIANMEQHLEHEDLQELVTAALFKAEQKLDQLQQSVTLAAVTV